MRQYGKREDEFLDEFIYLTRRGSSFGIFPSRQSSALFFVLRTQVWSLSWNKALLINRTSSMYNIYPKPPTHWLCNIYSKQHYKPQKPFATTVPNMSMFT